jgi:4-amino-4-deoxy-L-arabinose transferase-like glycosyltransferase
MPSGPDKLNLPRGVYWIALLAISLRVAARLYYSGISNYWAEGYTFFFQLAQSIARGQGVALDGIPTGFRVPLYSIFLAGLTRGHRAFWPVIIAQSLIGAAIVVLTALLARRLSSGAAAPKAAILAAALTALYPYYVFHDTALQETSLYTLLTLIAVLVLQNAAHKDSTITGIGAGVVLGLDVLTRATIAPFAALAPLWLFWHRRFRAGVACALFLLATVLPWVVRNYIVMGDPTLSTETGIQFWTGNNGLLFRYYPLQSSDVSKDHAMNSLTPQDRRELKPIESSEVLTSRWFFHKGLQFVRAHPWQTVIDGVRKNLAAFSWLPAPRRGRLIDGAIFFSFGPVMLLGLWGMFRHRAHWREDSLIYLLFATFMLITAVFWAQTSHRVHLDVYWIAFGSAACAETGLLSRRPAFFLRHSDSHPLPITE